LKVSKKAAQQFGGETPLGDDGIEEVDGLEQRGLRDRGVGGSD
jgi:hypothetical protein